MKKLISVVILLFILRIVCSQDIHFSQFNNSPLNLNPGLTGVFNGDIRLVANQRTQWRSVTTPYVTYGLAADFKQVFSNFNFGLGIYNDKAGDSEFSTLQIAPTIVYSLQIGDSTQNLTFAIQPSYVQRSINYANLTFDNQYDGIAYNPNLGNNEVFINSGRNYLNVHAGVAYHKTIAQRKYVEGGIAVHNINQPKQTFFSDNSIVLKQRLTIHANGSIPISDKLDGLPSILYMKQHKFKEIIFGGSGKYYLNNPDYKAVYLGIWYRNKDASYLSAGLDWRDFHFGISYDFNLSSLRPASHNRGGFEFAIIYIFSKYKPVIKRYKACPNYI
ncbi:MAG: hypothetical protein Kow0079_11220 [Vicingaceae bacterium]